MIKKWLLFIVSILFSKVAFAEYYDVPMMKADWELSTKEDSCSLKQDIPIYGIAEFVHRSGEPLKFSIRENRIKPFIIRADLAALPTPWIHDHLDRKIHTVFLDQPINIKDYSRLSVYGDSAEAMIDALLQGDSPTFTYVRAKNDSDLHEIRVAVSPIKFYAVYNKFMKCRTNLASYRS